jgi:hypothetical protein
MEGREYSNLLTFMLLGCGFLSHECITHFQTQSPVDFGTVATGGWCGLHGGYSFVRAQPTSPRRGEFKTHSMPCLRDRVPQTLLKPHLPRLWPLWHVLS